MPIFDDSEPQKKAVLAFHLFVWAAVVSFLYCLITDQYNGDFYPRYVYVPVYVLVLVLVLTVIPYAFLWRLTSIVDRMPALPKVRTSNALLVALLLVVFGWNIFATVAYGVAVMDSEVYSASGFIALVIQVGNRIDPFYVGAFFILATPKKWRFDVLAAVLMIGTGLLRAGLGAFIYVFIAVSIKYKDEIISVIKTRKVLSACVIVAVPLVISLLYGIRAEIRGDQMQNLSTTELLLGRFVGRLTSFPNVVYIVQESAIFQWVSHSLSSFYFIKQGAVSVLGSSVAPAVTPERLLIEGGGYYDGNSTYMAGLSGNLMMAWFLSPWVAAMNVSVVLGTTFLVLFMSRAFANGQAQAFGVGMLLYPLTSGVAHEFAYLLVNTAFLFFFVLIFRVSSEATHRNE